MTYLAVRGAILFNSPPSFSTQSLEHLVVVAMLGQFIVPIQPQTGEYLGSDGSAPPLPPLVVLPLFPCRQPRPGRHCPLFNPTTPPNQSTNQSIEKRPFRPLLLSSSHRRNGPQCPPAFATSCTASQIDVSGTNVASSLKGS